MIFFIHYSYFKKERLDCKATPSLFVRLLKVLLLLVGLDQVQNTLNSYTVYVLCLDCGPPRSMYRNQSLVYKALLIVSSFCSVHTVLCTNVLIQYGTGRNKVLQQATPFGQTNKMHFQVNKDQGFHNSNLTSSC